MFDQEIREQFYPVLMRIHMREYVVLGKLHRVHDAAYYVLKMDGGLAQEQWYINGLHHREGGPAIRRWAISNTFYIEGWYVNGRLHRMGGPASFSIDKNGELSASRYYLYGIQITDEIKEWAIASGIDDIPNMSPDELTMFKLTWYQNNV